MTNGIQKGLAAAVLLALLQGCASGERHHSRPAGRTVVAVYTEVDGVSFSTDGSPYAKFTDYLERDECVRLTPGQLLRIVDSLEREGFFKESDRELTGPARAAVPAAFRICVASPGRSRECVFLCERGMNVPVKYQQIFSTLPLPQVPAALDKFLKLNSLVDSNP